MIARIPAALPALIVLLGLPLAAGADDAHTWSRFRGPNGSGVSDATGIPATFTDKDVHWRVELGGEGHSSPVVWANRVFVTACDPGSAEQRLVCIDADTGKQLWTRKFNSRPFRQHRFNSFASSSCAVDTDHVYMVIAAEDKRALVALTHDGDERWRHDLGEYKAQHGSGTSPIVHGDLVILPVDHIEAGHIVALDRKTGATKWRLDRPGLNAAYATPIPLGEGADTRLVFCSQASGVTAVDPATGKVDWECRDGLFPKRVVSSPTLADGKILISCGQGGGGQFLAAVQPPTDGADAKVAWKLERAAPYVPTCVSANGLVFTIADSGVASCLDPATGNAHWQERIGGNYFSSPVVVNGVVYCVSRDGEVVTFKAADKFELIGRSKLGEESHATPAVANGRMYLRTVGHLLCIGAPAVR